MYSDDNIEIEKYFLKQTQKENPSICFLPTASADDTKYVMHFYTEFTKLNCKPSHLSLFTPSTRDIEAFLLEKDAIYIGGGSTKNMLALFREWDVDSILKKAYEKGIVLGGISAGMNCWYEECITDSFFGELSVLKCLGFLIGSACPHYDKEEKRRPAYQSFIKSKRITPGIAIDDNVAVHYIDGKISKVITTKDSNAYQVFFDKNNIVEKRLEAQKL
ncbi:MAG: peptidase E [Chlamydiae bacterium RIFCSPHIGHO2_12_FULL_27_8]|nr:MAG: peptidase E [Chlamydiae bacterium RIFCSPHIGHO2_12_FULL_27_8]